MEQQFCHKCGEYTDHLMDDCPRWKRPGHPYKRPESKRVNLSVTLLPKDKQEILEMGFPTAGKAVEYLLKIYREKVQ